MSVTADSQAEPGESLLAGATLLALVEEQLDIQIRAVPTGRVRISTKVVETPQVVNVPLEHDDVDIQRIAFDRAVEHALPVREEGGVTIVSLYEEIVVVTKQLVLKEELHIRRRKSVRMAAPQHVILRREEATVTRSPADPLS